MQHPFMFLSSLVLPAHLVNKMGPWLQITKQGMWPRQLPLAEETICLGWLLYSAPEYDLLALSQRIKKDTGGNVALSFQIIQMDYQHMQTVGNLASKLFTWKSSKVFPLSC